MARSRPPTEEGALTRVAQLTVTVAACDRPVPMRRCLDALLGGERLPAEIIVVDQSGDDAVRQAIAAGRAPPGVTVRCLPQARTGLSASRNAAVAQASHAIVAFTDDDCVPRDDWVAVVERVLTAEHSPAAVSGRVLPLGDPRPDAFVVSARVDARRRDHRGRMPPWLVGTGGNFAAHRTWLERVGPFDPRLGAGSPGKAAEDAELLYRLLRAGATIRYEPDAVVFHERQTAAQRLSSRTGYGYGIGAFCGLWLRRGDWYAGRLLGGWLSRQFGLLLRAGARRDWFLARQRWLSLTGGARGLVYGLRLSDQ
jgi:O-antigen biosynthesis protein